MTDRKEGPRDFDLVLAQVMAKHAQDYATDDQPPVIDQEALIRHLDELDTPQARLLRQQVQHQAQLAEAIGILQTQQDRLRKLLDELPDRPEI